MSSTNRGAVRTPNDFYVTDPKEIVKFLGAWHETDADTIDFWNRPRRILDPAAGGLTEQISIPQKGDKPPLVFMPCEMSYPEAIRTYRGQRVYTMDIRENSRAETKGDFLAAEYAEGQFDMVITNPPFSLALEFIRKSLKIVRQRGYVVMLLRLNFFGSEERNPFFLSGNMPQRSYVHSKRLGFTPDGKTDSIEYAHFVWQRTDEPNHETKQRVLPYK